MNVLVTGGSNGLGENIVRYLSQKGHNVLFTYCSSEINADKIVSSCKSVKKIHCDFTNEEGINQFISKLEKMPIDVLINNAISGYMQKHFHKISSNEIKQSFCHNVLPTIKITQACILKMRKNKFGRIITILSNYIENPPIGFSEYAANKHYLLSMSNSWGNENKKFNISSNCISPSFMLTNMTKDTDPRALEMMKSKSAGGSFLSVNEVTLMVESLINSSQHLNKKNIIYDL